jgi:adenylosuccinate synthase
MPVSVIVGAQFGSEGKGKISAFLCRGYGHSVRTGGPNAGHTVTEGERKIVVRQLPSAVVSESTKLYLGPGSIIDTQVLLKEISSNNVSPDRLHIDPQSIILDNSYVPIEKELVSRIGSTGKGVGAAVAAKVWRGENVTLAKDDPKLRPYISDVPGLLHKSLSNNENVLVEGTQGTGLSIHHGWYPYVTSRDVTAGSLLAESGLGPLSVDKVILVARTYPIRVAGTSGPLEKEIDWQTVTDRSGKTQLIQEYTTVTKRLRRVGEFNAHNIRRAAELNSASEIAVTFIDYLDHSDFGKTNFDLLSKTSRKFIEQLEDQTQVPVRIISTGPDTSHTIQLP